MEIKVYISAVILPYFMRFVKYDLTVILLGQMYWDNHITKLLTPGISWYSNKSGRFKYKGSSR